MSRSSERLQKLQVDIYKANAIVEATIEARDAAINRVLGACIHNISDAIMELGRTEKAYSEALDKWGVLQERIPKAKPAAHVEKAKPAAHDDVGPPRQY